MQVHLIDGTYELFRHFYAVPSHVDDTGVEVGATGAVVGSLLGLLEEGATHVGVATDHVIESFRNELWPGYKDGSGIDPALLGQFTLLEDTLAVAGLVVWPMVVHEADDALGAAALMAADDDRADRVLVCTPDKDLGQVVGGKVVQLDRRKGAVLDTEGVRAKFGVDPESIPDYLALVGDSADGFPGLAGWGAKSAAAVLGRYRHLEDVPAAPGQWDVAVRGAAKLAATLRDGFADALLFRRIATLETGTAVIAGGAAADVDSLRWAGPTPGFGEVAARLGAPNLARRAERLGAAR